MNSILWEFSAWLSWGMSGVIIFLSGEFGKLKRNQELFISGIPGVILNYLTLILIILMSSFLSAYSFHRSNDKPPTLLSLFIVSLFILPFPVTVSLVYYIPYLYKHRKAWNISNIYLFTFPPLLFLASEFDRVYNWISLLGR